MSTSSTSSGLSGSAQNGSEMQYKEALVIGAAVIGVIAALAVSKVGLYFVLDLCCDLDGGERRRCVREFLRKIFPFWNVRTQPEGMADAAAGNNNNVRRGGSNGNVEETVGSRERWTLDMLSERLSSHILTDEDVRLWKKEEALERSSEHSNSAILVSVSKEDEVIEHSESDKSELAFPCSICLSEMKTGDKVFRSTDCGHMFHFQCFAAWAVRVSASKPHIECPNCRTTIEFEEP